MARLDLSASGQAPTRAQQPFTYVCQDPACGVTNTIYDEEQNICRNCGQELWLGREAREARWYEEHGRRIGGKKGREYWEKGAKMNQEAGRPQLARAERRFGGLSGGEYWVKLGPDPEDQPDDYEPPEGSSVGCLATLGIMVAIVALLFGLLWLFGLWVESW